MSTPTSRRVGRPRIQERPSSGLEPRDEVLAAAADLFTTRGYTATSTRTIAERAGLRQASLYHYFDGKEAILAELLEGTVRPSLEVARGLVSRTEAAPEARLWALCHSDAALLCGGPHNLGALYLLPEAQTGRFADFHRVRAELKSCYDELLAATDAGASLGPDALALHTDLVFGLTESVILIRRAESDPDRDPLALAVATADAALRVAGVPQRSLARLRREGQRLLAARD
ncbi:TetR/AcrR family transcriptional regulator [Streptomyces sp. NBC_00102]|uniref:TetR/AcrR family transcriptional regulator n=1 Tax=Streptomyces sp. NBC_00102 TaxID=2975652 RepID=UPI002257C967|nr:TetR/AcrR family transcriptional regulator [Streptomyces sp. NBC_00102]MCX5402358.1 TetR/AcrR family transcriptional regulator [Streptomyces sp. NBC_00102]